MCGKKVNVPSAGLPRLQDLLDAVGDAAAIVDVDGSVLAANAAMADLASMTPRQMLGPGGWQSIVAGLPAESRIKVLADVCASRQAADFEIVRTDKTFFVRLVPVCDASGRVVDVACFARDISAQKHTAELLERKTLALEEMLGVADRQKSELAHSVVENVEKLIMPLIDDLKLGLPRQCAAVLDILASRLVEIVSPFTAALSHHSAGLSPAEIRLCDLIRRGMSSDQIAQHEHISPATVRKHREHIRRKLGIQGEQVSLVQHLEGFMRGSAY